MTLFTRKTDPGFGTPIPAAGRKAPCPARPATTADAPLLTVAEVARLDGCSEKTVRRAIAAGHLPALRIGPGGRMLRIAPAAHAAYRRAHLA